MVQAIGKELNQIDNLEDVKKNLHIICKLLNTTEGIPGFIFHRVSRTCDRVSKGSINS